MTGPARFQPRAGHPSSQRKTITDAPGWVSFEVGREDDESFGKRGVRKMDAPLIAKSSSYLCSIWSIAFSTRPAIETSFRASGTTTERECHSQDRPLRVRMIGPAKKLEPLRHLCAQHAQVLWASIRP